MTVALYSIKDLFNMQATCKVFLDAARYDAVYKEASMLELLIVSFLYYYGRPEHRFIECCAEAGNPVALLRVGMTEFVWIGHCDSGMDTLTMATTGGDLETCYMCAMLLLSHAKEDKEHMRKGLEFFEIVEVKLLDPGLPEVCWSTNCRTRGTMGDVEDLSRVSCVQCLADYEVRVFREFFMVEYGLGVFPRLDAQNWKSKLKNSNGVVEVYRHADPTFRSKRILHAEVGSEAGVQGYQGQD
ncbi:hypothetical protein AHAS_Ahas15G0224100 [Arachis hypogaea]